MSEEIIKQIQKQFDELPIQINSYISDHFYDTYEYVMDNVFHPLKNFSCIIHDRWEQAEKEHDVTCLYALPKKVFNKIEKENQQDFINVWNKVLEFIWNDIHDSKKSNYLYLLVRTHLVQDYGYFDTIDVNKLFRVKK